MSNEENQATQAEPTNDPTNEPEDTPHDLFTLAEQLEEQLPEDQLLEIIKAIRFYIGRNVQEIPLAEFIESNLDTKLITLLQENYRHLGEVQFEILWAFTNIFYEADEDIILDFHEKGLTKNLNHLLVIPLNTEILESALCILGNYSGTSLELRDILLESLDIEEFVRKGISGYSSSKDTCVSAALFLSNCLRGPPHPSFEQRTLFLGFLRQIVEVYPEDGDIESQVLWACLYFIQADDKLDERSLILAKDSLWRDYIKEKFLRSQDNSILTIVGKLLARFSSMDLEPSLLFFDHEILQVKNPKNSKIEK